MFTSLAIAAEPIIEFLPVVDNYAAGLLAAAPRPWSWIRHPRRFLRARLRMMTGKPLSDRWGLDRGMPAHRYYIALFLDEFKKDVRGKCMEFAGRDYLNAFGNGHVRTADVMNLDDSNPEATVIADITKPNQVPDNTYDCIICTHTLHVIYDIHAAIRGLKRILKPGGVLLFGTPHVSMMDASQGELWRFTPHGVERMMEEHFGAGNVTVRAYGNSLVAAGEMRGLIADEFTQHELHTHDPRWAIEVCARCVKR